MSPSFNYLRLDYKPDRRRELIATYRLEQAKGFKLEEVAQSIAAESSIGTWTQLKTLSSEVFEKLSAKIFKIEKEKKQIKIAYPEALFEEGNISQLLSSVTGNIFSMKEIAFLRLEDLEFSPHYLQFFPGPSFGLGGVRKFLKVFDRPIIGSIMKPKIGLTPRENAKLAYEVFQNGVDLIKDDENLTDLDISPFDIRVEEALKWKKKAEKETGQKKIYAFNVTAPVEEMLARASLVRERGGSCVMVDLVTLGFSALQTLREEEPGLIIHGHRAGHGLFDRFPQHGLSMYVLAKLARLAGVDQLHTGTVIGKMAGESEEVLKIDNFLREEWGGIRPVFPIASGGLHPGLVPELIKKLGQDLIINFGGGIHGHPGGSAAGARAVQSAVEAAVKGQSLKEKAEENPALKKALDYWL
jgi:ribulose-bisphosphate carboxylase large chain